mmetsp:Transcript_48700/g.35845  ORF Transcript_48700/g.35845 Transcript_48700/m.35845 type:complete len:130 (+) Transcript_48700:532-921(+)|eukprot:CAMPEP_0202959714 /NCGR_PEP_ID=MMETSP1396-20130829/3884_1 /ASSEMBLY_ACC=CAM_ASM_000872 /TAXON_ID= /ORGANISM="Pseudokeronopsis sp., Strain Brazil" /LENGTH=129 /DNA_ID=CAMNT_0049678419 /DNA_START=532 /DNA_END=921 /DNA_ORIENTATION=+
MREAGEDDGKNHTLEPAPLEPNDKNASGNGTGSKNKTNKEDKPHIKTVQALKKMGYDSKGAHMPPVDFLTPDGNFSMPGDFYEQFPPETVDDFPTEWLLDGAVYIPDEFYSPEGNWTMPLKELFLYLND